MRSEEMFALLLPLLGVTPALSIPASMAVSLFLLLDLGPTMPKWQLTGAHP